MLKNSPNERHGLPTVEWQLDPRHELGFSSIERTYTALCPELDDAFTIQGEELSVHGQQSEWRRHAPDDVDDRDQASSE